MSELGTYRGVVENPVDNDRPGNRGRSHVVFLALRPHAVGNDRGMPDEWKFYIVPAVHLALVAWREAACVITVASREQPKPLGVTEAGV